MLFASNRYKLKFEVLLNNFQQNIRAFSSTCSEHALGLFTKDVLQGAFKKFVVCMGEEKTKDV
jgi:hypothetical protein